MCWCAISKKCRQAVGGTTTNLGLVANYFPFTPNFDELGVIKIWPNLLFLKLEYWGFPATPRLFQLVGTVLPQSTNVTDGRTDGRTALKADRPTERVCERGQSASSSGHNSIHMNNTHNIHQHYNRFEMEAYCSLTVICTCRSIDGIRSSVQVRLMLFAF